jgi:8-oxo-dGTP diphosphatase
VPEPLHVVAWVCVQDNAVLGARTRGQALFYVPGGKPEGDEDHVAALLREVKEELGVDLDEASVRELTVITAEAHGAAAGRMVRMTCFTAEPANYSTEPTAAREIAEVAWLGLAQRDRFAPADQALLDFLCERGEVN